MSSVIEAEPKNKGIGGNSERPVQSWPNYKLVQLELIKRSARAGDEQEAASHWLRGDMDRYRNLITERPELLTTFDSDQESTLRTIEAELSIRREAEGTKDYGE